MRGLIYAFALALVLVSTAVAFQFYAIDQSRRAAKAETCTAFRNQYKIFSGQIISGEKLASGLAYYRQHPKELQKVLQATQRELVDLQKTIPDYC